MDSSIPPVLLTPEKRRLHLFLKLGGICLLVLLLQIPLAMMRGVLRERQNFQAQATNEIKATWGQSQLITGPALVVPYTVTRRSSREEKDAEGKPKTIVETRVTSGTVHFLPDTLTVQAEIEPEVRYRGIYEAVVYSARVNLKGEFRTDLTDAGVRDAAYDWSRATVDFGVTDARRFRAAPQLKVAGMKYAVESAGTDGLALGLTAKVPVGGPDQTIAFELNLDLQGSERLEVAPTGKTTVVQMHSSWTNPSFTGAQLPAARTINADGFKASWQLAHYGRGFPQSWSTDSAGSPLRKITEAGFGVSLSQPVTAYSMADRAQKYAVLFFVLVFAVFFLFEITAGLRVHPFQYALVGVALSLFFIGFLSLSEFWATGIAYLVSAAACTLMVSLYAWNFLGTGWRTLVIGGGLGATYGYLYFVLKSEDYALVAGTAALFATLALVMFCTRRINWYELDLPGTRNAGVAK
ncbi:MAG: Inner rane CreD family protein [Verrucomicrobia bacterium]|nr:Inner rane CreD family protein [Verrucomicrobiota bacterium]